MKLTEKLEKIGNKATKQWVAVAAAFIPVSYTHLGDSEFVPWSQAFLATKSILELDRELESSLTTHLFRIEEEVRTAAYKIIEAKKATYYGIGMALTRITKAILGDEHSVLTVSAVLRGEYDQRDVFTGVPCILNQNGVQLSLIHI